MRVVLILRGYQKNSYFLSINPTIFYGLRLKLLCVIKLNKRPGLKV